MWAKIGMAVKNFAKGKAIDKATQMTSSEGGNRLIGMVVLAIPVFGVLLLFIAPIIIIMQSFGNIWTIQAVDPKTKWDAGTSCVDINSVCGNPSGKTKVLFIGNSRTNLPAKSDEGDNAHKTIPTKFAQVARSYGYDVDVSVASEGGKTLLWLYENKGNEISKEPYDCVVMQETMDPYILDSMYPQFLEGATKIVNLVKEKNPSVKTYIRQTWTRRELTNNRKAIDGAYKHAEDVAAATDSYLVYDGRAWENVWTADPSVNLWDDSIHQNNKGTYVSALSVFRALYGQNVTGASYTSGYNSSLVQLFQNAADTAGESVSSIEKCTSGGLPEGDEYYPLKGKKNGQKLSYLEVDGKYLTESEFSELATFIANSVNGAGDDWGVRVATAGWALTYGLYERDLMLHYRKAGKWHIEGGKIINHGWGTYVGQSSINHICAPNYPYGRYVNFVGDCSRGGVRYEGMDCDGFTSWAQRVGCGKTTVYSSDAKTTSDLTQAKSGDPMFCNGGHVLLFVKWNDDGSFITAEESSGDAAGLFFMKKNVSSSSSCSVQLAHEVYDQICQKKEWTDVR